MNWKEIRIYTTTEAIDIVSGYLVTCGITGFAIEDAEDFSAFLTDTTIHWDYVEESLMEKTRQPTAIVIYLEDNLTGMETLRNVRAGLDSLREQNPAVDLGSLELSFGDIAEEDWSNAWKQYYHPQNIGKRLVVCPVWEKVELTQDQVQVTLDPGLAFGTGSHETTRLCMTLLEEVVKGEEQVLDIGTGSGILAITALRLGAKDAVGVDIDPVAVKIAGENAELNQVEDRCTFLCGDLVEQVQGKYDIICANIVADVIIRLSETVQQFMHENTKLIVSGIIDTRADEVHDALIASGLKVLKRLEENGWCSMLLMLP